MNFPGKQNARFQWIRVVLVMLYFWFIECKYSQINTHQVDRWAKNGMQYLKTNMCRRASSLMDSECKKFSHVFQNGVAVYISDPGTDKVIVILPDSESTRLQESVRRSYSSGPILVDEKRPRRLFSGSAAHDAVMVLDPSPGDNFGHPVFLFYIDFNITRKKCEHRNGYFTEGECLSVALKDHCQNQLRRRQSHVEHLERWEHEYKGSTARTARAARNRGHCEVHFLPLVVGVGDSSQTQRLHCFGHPGFAKCPLQLTHYGPDEPVASCELSENTRRCRRQSLGRHPACALYRTCDHAVLLSGGWRQEVTYKRHMRNLRLFYQMLRSNGFHKSHITVFFAGSRQAQEVGTGEVYPATEKEAIRNHIAHVCRKRHCADSLVLYLNSPACNDGSMLLWDSNNNGIAEQKERYAVDELLADVAGCRAVRVLLFVEQSYSMSIRKRLSGSAKHRNVVLLTASLTDVAEFWAPLHPTQCLLDYLNQVSSMPRPGSQAAGLLNVTLAGAPCDGMPPLTEEELRREYMGCQNLPTAVWYQIQRQLADEGQ